LKTAPISTGTSRRISASRDQGGDNLSLLCSGGRSKSPTEILESPAFGQLIERFKRQYDLVVIDSPPLGAVTDSLLIAERPTSHLCVPLQSRLPEAHPALHQGAPQREKRNPGIVLNGLSPRRIEYYSNTVITAATKKYYGAQT